MKNPIQALFMLSAAALLSGCVSHDMRQSSRSEASAQAAAKPIWDGGPLVADGVICNPDCTKLVDIGGQKVRVPMGFGWPDDWRDRPHGANGTGSSSGPDRRPHRGGKGKHDRKGGQK